MRQGASFLNIKHDSYIVKFQVSHTQKKYIQGNKLYLYVFRNYMKNLITLNVFNSFLKCIRQALIIVECGIGEEPLT